MIQIGVQYFQAAWIERAQPCLAPHHMQRCSLLRSSLGPDQRAVGKIERCQTSWPGDFGAALLPVQAAGDHEMQYQPKPFAGGFIIQTNRDALPHPAQFAYSFSWGARKRRINRAQQKRAHQPDAFQHLPENALLQRFDIDHDIGELGHAG